MVFRFSVGVTGGRCSEDSLDGKVRELAVDGESSRKVNSLKDWSTSTIVSSIVSRVTGVCGTAMVGDAWVLSEGSVRISVSRVSLLSSEYDLTCPRGETWTACAGRSASDGLTCTGLTTEKWGIKELAMRTGLRGSGLNSMLPKE